MVMGRMDFMAIRAFGWTCLTLIGGGMAWGVGTAVGQMLRIWL